MDDDKKHESPKNTEKHDDKETLKPKAATNTDKVDGTDHKEVASDKQQRLKREETKDHSKTSASHDSALDRNPTIATVHLEKSTNNVETSQKSLEGGRRADSNDDNKPPTFVRPVPVDQILKHTQAPEIHS